MHELGVVFHIMDSVEKIARENQADGIKKVVLELGEVYAVIESYLQNCWSWASKKRELFDGTELVVDILPAVTYCEGCRQTYSTVDYGKSCPFCNSPDTWLLQGNEFNIKEIEVY